MFEGFKVREIIKDEIIRKVRSWGNAKTRFILPPM